MNNSIFSHPTKKAIFIISISFILLGLFFSLIYTNFFSNLLLNFICSHLTVSDKILYLFPKTRPMFITNGIISLCIGFGFFLLLNLKFNNDTETTTIKILNKNIELNIIILIVIFLFLILIRCFWLSQKDSYHMDELYGIGIVNQQKYSFWGGDTFEINKAYTGAELKSLVFFDDSSLKDFLKDIIHLWIYNKDTAYTSLYLMLFRLSFIFTKTCDFWTINIHGFILNIIFLCFSFYFMILLLNELTDNKPLKYFLLICAFMNPASVSLSIFLRAYALQECLLILFTYFFILFYKKSDEGIFITKKNLLKGIVVIGIVISSDYFSMIYIGILGLIILIKSIIKKDVNSIQFFIVMFFISMLFAKVLYLNWGSGFLYGRGQEVLQKEQSTDNLKLTLAAFNNIISKNFFNFIIILVQFVVFNSISKYFSNANKQKTIILSLLSCIIWIFFVLYIAPYKTLRYIEAIIPLLTLFFIPIYKQNQKLSRIHLFFVCIFMTFIVLKILPLKTNFKNIEYIHNDIAIKNSNFLKDDIPVVIYYDSSYTLIIPYLNDEQTYYFAHSLDEAKNFSSITSDFWYMELENSKRPFKEILYKR